MRNLLRELLRLRHCALHALRAFGQHQFRTVGLHEVSALHAHGIRHHDDDAVAARRRNGCETYAGVAGSRLNDDRVLGQDTARLGIVQHVACNSILHRTRRVQILELCEDARLDAFLRLDVREFQERGAAD